VRGPGKGLCASPKNYSYNFAGIQYIEDQWESGFPRSPYAEQVEIAWMYSPLNVRQMMCVTLGKVVALLPKIIAIILLRQYKDIADQWESGFPRSMRKQDQATGTACTSISP
jgi:hypothetical protein